MPHCLFSLIHILGREGAWGEGKNVSSVRVLPTYTVDSFSKQHKFKRILSCLPIRHWAAIIGPEKISKHIVGSASKGAVAVWSAIRVLCLPVLFCTAFVKAKCLTDWTEVAPGLPVNHTKPQSDAVIVVDATYTKGASQIKAALCSDFTNKSRVEVDWILRKA